MSMPTFPDEGIDITQEQAFNMLLGSIAMEELALSHILNSEGEKLQYVLGTLPASHPTCPPTPCELLKINQSITSLLENVSHNQLLLKSKLQQVLDAKEKWCPPCPAECGKTHCCPRHMTWVFHQEKSDFWNRGCPLYWKRVCDGECRKSEACAARASFDLDADCVYLVSYSFELSGCTDAGASVALQCIRKDSCENIRTECAHAGKSAGSVYLNGSAVLSPVSGKPTPSPIRFVLLSPDCVTVEHAVLTLSIL